jgi:hypothetical protein
LSESGIFAAKLEDTMAGCPDWANFCPMGDC